MTIKKKKHESLCQLTTISYNKTKMWMDWNKKVCWSVRKTLLSVLSPYAPLGAAQCWEVSNTGPAAHSVLTGWSYHGDTAGATSTESNQKIKTSALGFPSEKRTGRVLLQLSAVRFLAQPCLHFAFSFFYSNWWREAGVQTMGCSNHWTTKHPTISALHIVIIQTGDTRLL